MGGGGVSGWGADAGVVLRRDAAPIITGGAHVLYLGGGRGGLGEEVVHCTMMLRRSQSMTHAGMGTQACAGGVGAQVPCPHLPHPPPPSSSPILPCAGGAGEALTLIELQIHRSVDLRY